MSPALTGTVVLHYSATMLSDKSDTGRRGELARPPTVAWGGDGVDILDQTQLPGAEVVLHCTTVEDVVDAIRRLAVRGAPAIGVAGAYGVALAALRHDRRDAEFDVSVAALRDARPTAANLARMVDRVAAVASASPDAYLAAADAIRDEELAASHAMGERRRRPAHRPARRPTVADHDDLQHRGSGDRRAGDRPRRDPDAPRAPTTRRGDSARNQAAPAGRATDDLGAGPDGRPTPPHRRLRGCLPARSGRRRCRRSSVPIASPPTVTRPTRSAPSRSPSRRATPASRSSSSPRSRASTWRRRTATPSTIEDRGDDEVCTIGAVRITPPGTRTINPAFDVTPVAFIDAIVRTAIVAVVDEPIRRDPGRRARSLKPPDHQGAAMNMMSAHPTRAAAGGRPGPRRRRHRCRRQRPAGYRQHRPRRGGDGRELHLHHSDSDRRQPVPRARSRSAPRRPPRTSGARSKCSSRRTSTAAEPTSRPPSRRRRR